MLPRRNNVYECNGYTLEFLRFFLEAYTSVNRATGRPFLEAGDTIVMDNCPIHHHEGEHVLREFLNDLTIELVYMPAYCPDFKSAEYVFGKFKHLLKLRFWEMTNTDMKKTLYTAINFITPGDMRSFYEIAGYLMP